MRPLSQSVHPYLRFLITKNHAAAAPPASIRIPALIATTQNDLSALPGVTGSRPTGSPSVGRGSVVPWVGEGSVGGWVGGSVGGVVGGSVGGSVGDCVGGSVGGSVGGWGEGSVGDSVGLGSVGLGSVGLGSVFVPAGALGSLCVGTSGLVGIGTSASSNIGSVGIGSGSPSHCTRVIFLACKSRSACPLQPSVPSL